jgi:hypothetical protein
VTSPRAPARSSPAATRSSSHCAAHRIPAACTRVTCPSPRSRPRAGGELHAR